MEVDTEMDSADIAKLKAVLKTTEDRRVSSESNPEPDPRETGLREALAAGEGALQLLDRLLQTAIVALSDCRERRLTIEMQLQQALPVRARNPPAFKNIRWPYFKDLNKFLPPDNEDTKSRKKLQLPDLIRLPPVYSWSLFNKRCLQKSIAHQSRVRAVNVALSNIKALRRQNADDESICAAEEALARAKSDKTPIENFIDPLSAPDTYDWDMVAASCRGRSAFECQTMWRVFLHPQINKSRWTSSEVDRLKELVNQMETRHWDKIAEELGTNRTAYQCFVYYKMFIRRNHTAGVKWTHEEDQYVFNVVESCRVGDYIPWSKVAFYVENRSKLQIYNRWLHIYKYYKQGKFSREEEAVLETGVVLFGRDFKKISSYLPGRSQKAITDHYYTRENHRNILNWSLAEDTIIMSAKRPLNFQEIRKKLPNRSLISIHRRYVVLVKWVKKHPRLALSHLDRNKVTPVTKFGAILQFNNAIKALSKIRPNYQLPLTLLTTRKKKRKDPVDKQLVQYFQQLDNKQIETPKKSPTEINDIDPLQLKSILFLLGVKLNINLFNSFYSENLTRGMKALNHLLKSKSAIPVTKPSGIRTYSRKNKAISQKNVNVETPSTIKMNIWQHESENSSSPRSNFPPSLQTISAIQILSLLKFNHIHRIAKRFITDTITVEHNEKLDLWISRFEALFTWPLLLTYIIPNNQLTMFLEDKKLQTTDSNEFEVTEDSTDTEFTHDDTISKTEPMD